MLSVAFSEPLGKTKKHNDFVVFGLDIFVKFDHAFHVAPYTRLFTR